MNYSEKKNGKNPEESKAETTIVMLPSDANPKGNVFGGVILKHVDLIAGLVAKRHAGHANVVTASIDKMSFLKPIFIAFVTLVAIDKYGKPTAVPPLIPDNDDDKRRFQEGETRMKSRLNEAAKI